MIDEIREETVFALCEDGQLAYARDRYIAMIAKLTSLAPTILTAALAVIFVVAGIIERQRAIPPSAEADIGDAFGSTTTRVPRVTRL